MVIRSTSGPAEGRPKAGRDGRESEPGADHSVNISPRRFESRCERRRWSDVVERQAHLSPRHGAPDRAEPIRPEPRVGPSGGRDRSQACVDAQIAVDLALGRIPVLDELTARETESFAEPAV